MSTKAVLGNHLLVCSDPPEPTNLSRLIGIVSGAGLGSHVAKQLLYKPPRLDPKLDRLFELQQGVADRERQQGRAASALAQHYNKLDLTGVELAFLLQLVVRPGIVRPAELRNALGIGKRHVHKVGQQLVKKGLIKHIKWEGYSSEPLLEKLGGAT